MASHTLPAGRCQACCSQRAQTQKPNAVWTLKRHQPHHRSHIPSAQPTDSATQTTPAAQSTHAADASVAQLATFQSPLSRRAALLVAATASSVCLRPDPTVAAPVARPFCGVVNPIPEWAYKADWQEGTIDYAGFKTWYRMLGKPAPKKTRKARSLTPQNNKIPVLVLHGGPGMPSRYLESFELLGVTERPVVFYDQIGCGNSRHASDGKGPGLSRITPDLFIKEIDAVRSALGLDRVHLLGHGWGGMLALAYVTQAQQEQETQETSSSSSPAPASEDTPYPSKGIVSVTLVSTPPSLEALVNDRREKAQLLGDSVWSALQREDDSPVYQEALRQYQQTYVYCTQPVQPGCLQLSPPSPSINKAMTGGKLFTVGGVLADWSMIGSNPSALSGLPTLVVNGGKQELSPESISALLKGPLASADISLLDLPEAGTMAHIDAHEALLERFDAHLQAHDL